jgi:hypothetical protein
MKVGKMIISLLHKSFPESANLPSSLHQSNVAEQLWSTTLYLSATDKENPRSTINPNKWNALFRGIGVDGVVDPGLGIIHANEPTQAVFFSTTKLEIVKQLNNVKKSGSSTKHQGVMPVTTRKSKAESNTFQAIIRTPAYKDLLAFLQRCVQTALVKNEVVSRDIFNKELNDFCQLIGQQTGIKLLAEQLQSVLSGLYASFKISMQAVQYSKAPVNDKLVRDRYVKLMMSMQKKTLAMSLKFDQQ